ncbi:MAG: hypothetical protein QF903_06415 [Planctomycetota bacterium]|jgi:hypothetical protein|nr:hypothetical protein [Planctomycetota bacterium]MDP6762105.1 hypothetical protein [Planctomycetota bacterium]MDP6989094.1 hypothetical protein [Planctomycetota bacterium]
MSQQDHTATYEVRIRGLFRRRHVVCGPDGELGVVRLRRNRWGMVAGGSYRPTEGEVLLFRRDPGILRSQFSLWTEGREWLGASLRWSFAAREISISTGGRPFRVVPMPGLRRGWRLVAPKTGEVARIHAPLFRRRITIEVGRRLDFELLLFAYFLAAQIMRESVWPGPQPEGSPSALAATGRS